MKKSICFPLAVLPALLLNACIFFSVNNDFDVDNGYFRNNSSHNIYIQECYLPDNDNSGNKIYNEHGEAIEKNTVANGAPAPNSYSTYLEKILIVDTDTRKLLKRISAEEYFKLLGPPEIVVKNNKEGGKTTHHNYYFDITDVFLNGN